MDKKLIKNIYRIYQFKTLKFDFFVKKYDDDNYIAKIKSIENVIEGEKIEGIYPFYNNQEVIVDLYLIDNYKNLGQIKTYTIKRIKENTNLWNPGHYIWMLLDEVIFIEI